MIAGIGVTAVVLFSKRELSEEFNAGAEEYYVDQCNEWRAGT